MARLASKSRRTGTVFNRKWGNDKGDVRGRVDFVPSDGRLEGDVTDMNKFNEILWKDREIVSFFL